MKPIIFSTPMVQAILAGRKTQTRRVIKINGYPITSPTESLELTEDGLIYHSVNSMSGYYKLSYQPSDILWVRETWQHLRIKKPHRAIPIDFNFIKYIYKADGEIANSDGTPFKWRPSIHMPREAARIFLRVLNVRVERLQDISVQDAKNEGIRVHANGCVDGLAFGCYNGDDCVYNRCKRPIEYFHELWDSINAKRGYGWNKNPWVWVYEFEKISKEEAERLEG